MVRLLIPVGLIHGEIAGEIIAGGANQRVEVGKVVIGAVFRNEGLALVDLEAVPLDLLTELGEGIAGDKEEG